MNEIYKKSLTLIWKIILVCFFVFILSSFVFDKRLISNLTNTIAKLGPEVFISSNTASYFVQNSVPAVSTEYDFSISSDISGSISVIPKVNLTIQDLTNDDYGVGEPNIYPTTKEEKQDLLDDIQEKLDILSQQVNNLVIEYQNKAENEENVLDKEDDEEKTELEDEKTKGALVCTGTININTSLKEDLEKIINVGPATAQKIIEARPFCFLNDLLKVSGIGEKTLQKIIDQGCAYVETFCGVASSGGGVVSGGGSTPVYPEVLISEIKISEKNGDDNVFLELYNPNDTEVDLTNWYIFRNGTSFITKSMLSGKKIYSKDYFLIAKEGSVWTEQADLLFDGTLNDDDSIILKKPNGDLADETSWQEILENLSWGRKWNLDTGTEQNFELQTPTPKYQNITYIAPEVLPILTDITPPEVLFDIEPSQSELNFSINFTITDISETTVPSGIGSYIFRWQEGENEWQEDVLIEISGSPSSADFIRDLTGEDGKTYNFQIQATDIAENISNWLPAIPATTTINIPVLLNPILINEIQINPIEQRFIELYNPNNVDVDLTGYYLQRKTKTGENWDSLVSSTNFDGKIISTEGYFLISREIINSDILLDITLSDDNSLIFKNANREIVDKVGYGSAQDFETMPAENPLASQSITRTEGIDTNDNSIDFIILDTPTPKE